MKLEITFGASLLGILLEDGVMANAIEGASASG
jgi:hypothetical protein